jgi:flagellar biosynthetic protein FliP
MKIMRTMISWLIFAACCFLAIDNAEAAPGLGAVTVTTAPGGGQTYSINLQILILMTILTLLPAGLLMMTSFTRIIIVLALLRQALGTQTTPTNQTLIGLALFLTYFVMSPVIDKVNADAVGPYLNDQITFQQGLSKAQEPFRKFMFAQTRENDLSLFMDMAGDARTVTADTVPFSVLVPSFITSELKTAFQIGFMIFIPFLIIDLVVASVLMAMGMMMLSPVIISLPFKLMLFVLVDGWTLVIGTLASSFYR